MVSLLEAGLVQAGASGLGLSVTEDGRAIDRGGEPNCIFLCGPDLRDRDFLATAVGDLRLHAKTAAHNVLQHLGT